MCWHVSGRKGLCAGDALMSEFMLTASRSANYGQRVVAMRQSFLDGFRELMRLGADFGIIERQNADSKAYVLALVIDNITSYIMMDIRLDYQAIWSGEQYPQERSGYH